MPTPLHLSRDDRERLGNALMAYKRALALEAARAPDLVDYNQIEAGEADDLAGKLDLVGDYYQPGYPATAMQARRATLNDARRTTRAWRPR